MKNISIFSFNNLALVRIVFRKVIPFLLILYCASFVINCWLLAKIHRIDSGNFGVWNKLVKGQINADILIMGSSRALFHFDSNNISAVTNKSCYNIGINATHLEMQAPEIFTYYRYNKPPKVLVVSLDAYSLNQRSEIFDPFQYIPYLDETVLYQRLVKLDKKFLEYKYIPLYGFARFKKELLEKAFRAGRDEHGLSRRINGYIERDIEWTEEFDKFKHDNPNGVRFAVEDKCICDLESIIELANRYNTKVILVYTPEYLANQGLTVNRTQIFNTFAQISKKYKIPFWDYSNMYINTDTYYFYNSQHLNKRGVNYFMNEFAPRLNTYMNANHNY